MNIEESPQSPLGRSVRRWRAPEAKPGELLMRWGKLPHSEPDMCIAWGEGCSKTDAKLLNNAIASEHPDLFAEPLFSKMMPSLIDELESRGYDITTLRFSIRKTTPNA